VALDDDRAESAAPRVVAKGADFMAARLPAVFEESRVPPAATPAKACAPDPVEPDADIPPDRRAA